MVKDSLLLRSEVFIAAACVAAHANAAAHGVQSGFRQRDVRFFLELFSNWVDSSITGGRLGVQNTQLSRYIIYLQNEGFARQVRRSARPVYRLTRPGLLELLSRIVQGDYRGRREYFLFLYYFVSCYKPRISALVKLEGKLFPPALQIELEALLDEEALLQSEVSATKQELRKLEIRIADAEGTCKLTREMLRDGAAAPAIVAAAEKRFPYELNSLKPLRELMQEIPPDQRLWELETGNTERVRRLWIPQKTMLLAYLSHLESLRDKE